MEDYNFDRVINRRHTKSLKFDFAVQRGRPADINPFWVADMDFEVPPAVKQALHERVEHGIFGYTETDDTYFSIVSDWFKRRFDWEPQEDWLVKTPGIVFALAMAVQAFTEPGEGVLIQQPVYYPFSEVIEANHRKLINSPLVDNGQGYDIDFEDFEKKIQDNDVKLFLLCSPHNPGGKVFSKEELETMAHICLKHKVVIVADEIHADFVWAPHKHTVFPSLSEKVQNNCILCTSPSKTFNIAGTQLSNIWIANERLRTKFKAAVDAAGYSQVGTFGIEACQAAYQYGEEWLHQVKSYIWENIKFTKEYFEQYLPKLKMYVPEGTYLVWFDCSALPFTAEEREQWLWHQAKLWLDSGAIFGKAGEKFERINVACPRVTLEGGLNQLRQAYEALHLD